MSSSFFRNAARIAPVLGVPFALGAIHHLIAIASPTEGDTSSRARHLVFVAINLFFGVAYSLRARWVIVPAVLLALQQTYSHGSAFVGALRIGSFDGESFAVLCLLPVTLIVAIGLAKARRRSQ